MELNQTSIFSKKTDIKSSSFSFIDNVRLQMETESHRVQELSLKIEQQTSLGNELIKSELNKAQEKKSQEITTELKKEINMAKERADEVSIKVEKSINKLEQLSSFNEKSLRTDLKNLIEVKSGELTDKLDNYINTITKRIENLSSELCASSTKIDRLNAFDPSEATLEMTKLIEKKIQEVSKENQTNINKETQSLRNNTMEEVQKLNRQADKTQNLLDEIKDENKKLSKF